MQINVKALAEGQNWFVVHHWYDGLALEAFGVPMGPVMAYNVLQVVNGMWLAHFDAIEKAQAEQRAKAEAAQAERDRAVAAGEALKESGIAVVDEATPVLAGVQQALDDLRDAEPKEGTHGA